MPQTTQDDRQLEALWQVPSHWRFGLLYCAPADPRVFVPKRGSAGFAIWATR